VNELLSELLDCLALTREGDDRFRGICETSRHGRIFGGQVLGQALMAARLTVDDRPAHSMQAYFLRRGDPEKPIEFFVDRLRDGRSFSARRVLAIQDDRELLSLQASFHAAEPGYEHQDPMPEAPPPESLPAFAELVERMQERFPARSAGWAAKPRSIEMRHTVVPSYLGGEPGREPNLAWFRAEAALPEDPLLHQCLIAYTSDMAFNDNALRAHVGPGEPPLQAMSTVDHAIWFHEPARADEWLLFAQQSPKAARARGFVSGTIYSRDGRLVASVGQDSLMRPEQTAG
jgi:acyl-CoA thioesterase-2